MTLNFEWDNKKNTSNQKKHRISFEEAKTVFYDENAILFFDNEHSDDEDRYIMLGQSERQKTLIVCHCHIENRKIIRIFSARLATKKEKKHYFRGDL